MGFLAPCRLSSDLTRRVSPLREPGPPSEVTSAPPS